MEPDDQEGGGDEEGENAGDFAQRMPMGRTAWMLDVAVGVEI